MKKFFTGFNMQPKGLYRLNIACSFILPFILAIIAGVVDSNINSFLTGLIVFVPIYWILAGIELWVYAGFKDEAK